MKRNAIFALLAAAVTVFGLFSGCSAKSGEVVEQMRPAVDAGLHENDKLPSEENVGVPNRKLIRTVFINAETNDMDALLSQLDSQVAALGGYVESKQVYNGSASSVRSRSAQLTLRIPAEHLDSLIQKVAGATNITSTSENTEDVTLSYIATQSRITALETEQARLLELLAKAETMDDLLLIESKLTQVRTELEEVKSKLKLYNNLVDYGTVDLSITEVETYTVVQEPTLWQRICDGFVSSVHNVGRIFTELLVFFIAALPYLVPMAVIALIVLLVVKLSGRRNKRAK